MPGVGNYISFKDWPGQIWKVRKIIPQNNRLEATLLLDSTNRYSKGITVVTPANDPQIEILSHED